MSWDFTNPPLEMITIIVLIIVCIGLVVNALLQDQKVHDLETENRQLKNRMKAYDAELDLDSTEVISDEQ